DPAPSAPAREPPVKGARRRAVRGAVLVVLPLILIIGAAAAALGWYARSSYFVGTSGDEGVIYKGVPGGVLGWNPTVDQRTGLRVEALTTLDRDRVMTNSSRGSLATAREYVDRLADATTTTTSSTTTTTVKRRTPPRRTTTTTVRPRTAT